MKKPRFEVAVGLFVVVGFLILSMIVFFVSGVYFFRPGYHLTALFDFVGIINQGAPVRFSGVRVGEVTDVKIVLPETEADKTRVAVTFFIEQGVVVKENDEVSVRGTHIMSEPHIGIMPVLGHARVLKDGDMIENGVSPYSMDDLFKESSDMLQSVNKMLSDVGSVFDDPETREMFGASLKNMARLLESMNTIVVGEEEEIGAVIVNMNQLTAEMTETFGKINRAEGTIGKLITEDLIYNELADFVHEIKTHPWRLMKKK
jgi:phospholipid/cholesterol/gamma-HCH transport system substrate-binding protein